MGNIFKEPNNFINAFIGGPFSGAFATVNLLNAFLATPGERTQEEIEKFFDLFNHTTKRGCIRTQMTSVASLGRVILSPRYLLDGESPTLKAAEFLKNSTDKLIEAMLYMIPLQGKNDQYPENLQKLAEVFAKFALETIAKEQLTANAAAWTKIFLPYLVPISRNNAFTKFLDGEGIACKRFTLNAAPQIVCDITANNYFTSAFVKAFDNYMSQENPQISQDTFNKLKILVEEDRRRLNLPSAPARIEHEFTDLSQNEIEQPHARIVGEQVVEAIDIATVTPAIKNHQEEREAEANHSHTSKINKTIYSRFR